MDFYLRTLIKGQKPTFYCYSLIYYIFQRSFNTFVGRALDPPIEKEVHTLERLGVFAGHGSSTAPVGGDKAKRVNTTATNQQNTNEQKMSIQNRATMAKIVLNLIAFVQKQAPVI